MLLCDSAVRIVDLGNYAIYDANSAVRVRGYNRIMGGDDKGFSRLFAQLGDELENVFAVARIQIARRLICNYESGIGCQRTSNRNTLLLTARELIGTMIEPV